MLSDIPSKQVGRPPLHLQKMPNFFLCESRAYFELLVMQGEHFLQKNIVVEIFLFAAQVGWLYTL